MRGRESSNFDALISRVNELKDLDGVLGLLSWDEETYAPSGSRVRRGQQTATLEAIRHQKLTDPALGGLIEALEGDSSADAASRILCARLRRRRDLALRLPESLVKALAETRSSALDAWQLARSAKRFSELAPHLERTLDLLRAKADALGYEGGQRYDALLDEHEPGMKTARLTPVLESLRGGLVPMVDAILGAPRPDRRFLEGKVFDVEKQWNLTLRLLDALGFSKARGRQDRSAHPFMVSCSEDDVRITTRLFEDNPLSAIFSTIHECGHALYEQGFLPEHHRTCLAEVPSAGLHESQSRLFENNIGRSLAFWRYCTPLLVETFPSELSGVDADTMVRAVNFVEASPIRVEADEVTYNLHILVRFELELALVDGRLSVADLPGAWREKMQRYLGIVPKDDAEGCLQDIHWSWGAFGYFPTYAIGNLYAAQLTAALERAHPRLGEDIAIGRFSTLLEWLREHVHRVGHLDLAEAIVSRATGEGLSTKAFLDHLARRYGALYGLRLGNA